MILNSHFHDCDLSLTLYAPHLPVFKKGGTVSWVGV